MAVSLRLKPSSAMGSPPYYFEIRGTEKQNGQKRVTAKHWLVIGAGNQDLRSACGDQEQGPFQAERFAPLFLFDENENEKAPLGICHSLGGLDRVTFWFHMALFSSRRLGLCRWLIQRQDRKTQYQNSFF